MSSLGEDDNAEGTDFCHACDAYGMYFTRAEFSCVACNDTKRYCYSHRYHIPGESEHGFPRKEHDQLKIGNGALAIYNSGK